MAEDATKKAIEPSEPLPKEKGLADVVAEFKAKPEKAEKGPKLQIPPNFLKELKNVNESLGQLNETSTKTSKTIDSFYKKFLAFVKENKIEKTKKESEEVKTDDTTGQEAQEALKTKEPQPVSIVNIDTKVLDNLTKVFNTLGLQNKPSKAAVEQATSPGGGDKDGILTKVFGNKLTPIIAGLGAALALAVGSWFDSGPFKGLMKEIGKMGTKIFSTKLVAEASKLFPSLIKFIKPIARRLPVIGTIIDFGSAISRITKGDFIGGIIDLASGVANLVPGIGTVISIGLGFLNAARDLSGQTKDAKEGKASKEGNIFAILTQAVVKWGAKILPKLKFLPILGSLFSFASAYNNFKSGKVVQGILDLVAGVAGFFPGVGTVVSLLASGASLIMGFFGEEKTEMKDPKDLVDVPKSTGPGLLSRLTKFLSDKFKDVMKGALQFIKKLPFVPDFLIEKVSKFLGIEDSQTAAAAAAPVPTGSAQSAPARSYAEVDKNSNLPSPKPGTTDIRTLPPQPAVERYTIEARMDFEADYKKRQRLGIESGQIVDPAAEAARRAPERLEEMRRIRAKQQVADVPDFVGDKAKPSTPPKKEIPKAKDGGIFSGPKEGYVVELHGTEAVIPLKDTSDKKTKISMERLVSILKDSLSDDNKDRYESKMYEELKNNLKYFERQVRSQKDLTEEYKQILYSNAMIAQEISMGKNRRSQTQANAYTSELFKKFKYDKEKINIVRSEEQVADIPQFISENAKPTKKDLPKAKDGGIFSGPKEGYPVELHGTEAVVPLKDTDDPKSKIAAVQQSLQSKDTRENEKKDYSMTRFVGMLKDFLSDDNKDRYDPEMYKQLKSNLKYFERQLKSQKELTEDNKRVLYSDAMLAQEISMGKNRRGQAQAIAFDTELAKKLKYDSQKTNIVNDWKVNKDKNWSEITSVKETNTAKKARFGGIFSGSKQGYDVTLHGDEAVIPLQPDTKSKVPLEAPLTQLPGMPGSNLIDKIDELIQIVKERSQGQSVDNSSVTGLNTYTGGSNVTNVYQNSSERDIPYVERNKYRQKLIYSRGLI